MEEHSWFRQTGDTVCFLGRYLMHVRIRQVSFSFRCRGVKREKCVGECKSALCRESCLFIPGDLGFQIFNFW